MAGRRLPCGLLGVLLLLGGTSLCAAFKAHEFKTCEQAHFCKRNRHRAAGSSTLALTSGALQGGRFVGTLRDTASEGAEFSVEISSYGPDTIRVRIDEQPSKGRFQVPDVLDPGLAARWTPLEQGGGGGGAAVLVAGDHEVAVGQSPFSVRVARRGGGREILSINGRGLLSFEQLRAKPEGGEADTSGIWEEDFRGNHDTKPKGPESIALDVTFHDVDHVYGIPERATSLALKATRAAEALSEPYRMYNLDVFEYDAESPFGLYGSVPFMMGHGGARGAAGFFWLNAAEMWVDVLAPGWDGAAPRENEVDTHWIAESGVIDAFVFLGPAPKDVVRQYTAVTATMAMPQLFALGYHQCRWNYKDEADVANVNQGFETHDIPYDTLWLDIEHTDGKKYLTWDPVHFPHPVEMQNKIGALGRHMVTIVDPHMKRDESYPLYTESTQKGYLIKNAGGGDFDGWCWPGSSSYLDMLSPEIRAWWATKFTYENYKGSTPILQIWNDMNEPSVFNGPEVTMPKDALHVGGVEHRDVHNAYGYYYHLASAQGLLDRDGGRQRPFVLSRAKFAGTQRAGPVWTGDNSADWDHLKKSVPMIITLGLAGMAFSGADVGGFFGNPDAELLTRWYQLGAFYPFFRGHAHLDTKRREPWIFGEPYTSHIREAIRARYALLPYYYTLFREAHLAGTPVMRPLFLEFPGDAAAAARDDSFLVGGALLVRAVMDQGATSVEVYLPGEEPWYDARTGRGFLPAVRRTVSVEVALDTVPVFQRGGTIVPRRDRPRRSSTQMEADPFTLIVALDSKGEAEGELYLDDGRSYDFQDGAYIHRRFRFAGGHLESTDGAPPGKPTRLAFATDCVVERIVVMGMDGGALARNVRATLETDEGAHVPEEMGPPLVRPGVPSSALVVRAPGVRIADDWKIKILS